MTMNEKVLFFLSAGVRARGRESKPGKSDFPGSEYRVEKCPYYSQGDLPPDIYDKQQQDQSKQPRKIGKSHKKNRQPAKDDNKPDRYGETVSFLFARTHRVHPF